MVRRVRRGGFTLIELLVVISIIGILAGLIVGISGVATKKSRLARTRIELSKLVSAIERYRSGRGYYPPDARLSDGRVNTATNLLFYELTGTLYTNRLFRSLQAAQGFNRQVCRHYFGVDGIQNTHRDPDQVDSFVALNEKQHRAISQRPEVQLVVAPISWPVKPVEGFAKDGRRLESLRPIQSNDPNLRTVNPWHYRASGPGRINTESFDLWADIVIGRKVYRVSNWRDQPEVLNRDN